MQRFAMAHPARHPGTLLLALSVSACGMDSADADMGGVATPATRDSAGIRIVDNERVEASGWLVATTPQFVVGWRDDEPTFTWVQSGRILPDGGAVVGDFGAGSIFRIGPDGTVEATWGRKGGGPGEYQALDAMLGLGDSILVSDGRLRRITTLSEDGDVLGTQPLPGAFMHQVSSILANGKLLLIPAEGYAGVSDPRPEWVFEQQPIIAAARDGSTIDTLAVLPHLRRWYGTPGASPGPVPVHGRAGGFADGFAWARSDLPEVRWYDGGGRLVQVARWDEAPTPLTRDVRQTMAASVEASMRAAGADPGVVAGQLAALEEGFDLHDGPLPYWDSFHVDRQGNAWLREYSMPGDPSATWRVITRDGLLAGSVDLPDLVTILDIADDRVLAVRFDEFDVPAVVMLKLER